MMLSILIPVYDFDIRILIRQLSDQCKLADLNFEIICLDDASSSLYHEFYEEIKKELSVQWVSTSINMGRSAARNVLARHSKFDNLLFLDCDVFLPDNLFINRYVVWMLDGNFKVIYGSCIYQTEKPIDQNLLLHWSYGTKKENPSLKVRNKNPYDTFHTVNFLVKRDTMMGHLFDESIGKYGYEDSLWAKTLEENNIDIHHIQNPVLHKGIHPAKHFLRKTAQAIHNLIYLDTQKKTIGTKLFKFIKKIRAYGLENIVFKIYRLNERRIVRNLLGDHPSLFYLSIYKLGLFMRFRKKIFSQHELD